jgi:hypothetical protein
MDTDAMGTIEWEQTWHGRGIELLCNYWTLYFFENIIFIFSFN